jgi:hypothetical protein
MSNKAKKKPALRLRRETLAPLDEGALESVRGGLYQSGGGDYGGSEPPPPPTQEVIKSLRLCTTQNTNHNRRAIAL